MNEFDPASNSKLKRYAELEVERQSASVDRLLDQHIEDFKWLTASLLLLNSGSIAAVLNSSSVSICGKQLSASFYLVGIVLALFIGVVSQRLAMQMLNPIMGYRAFWIAISQGETFDAEAEKQAVAKVQASAKHAWIAPALGWLSAIAFLAGSILAGLHLIEANDLASHVQPKSTSK